ncbi:hypothetical protein [Streptacidiphilus cavernicola]|uniref:DUF222 domain-containing protein n=1 Tax=Streptacidiphilus cavernicola TaxID=3342716 RepID=A0ABV6W3H0_9ACTN
MNALDLSTDETTTPAATGDASADARQNLIDYASLGGFTLTSETHAWYAAVDTVGSPEAARAASTVLAELRGRDLPATREAATRIAEETTLGRQDSVVAVGRAVALTLRVRSTLEVLMPSAYESDQLKALAAATGSGRWRREQDAKLTFGQRLNLGRAARNLAVAKRPRRGALHAALVSAEAERTEWAATSPTGDKPALPADLGFLDASAQAVDAACEALAELGRLKVDANPAALSLDELGELVDRLASDEGTLHRLPALRALRESLEQQGYGELVAELTAARADAEAVAEAVVREFGADGREEAAAEEESPQALVPAPREENPAGSAGAEVEAEAEADAEVKVVAEVETEVEVETDAEVQAGVEVEVEAEAEVAAETEAEVEVAAEATPVVEEQLDFSEPEPEPEPEAVAAEPEVVAVAAEPEPVAEPEAVAVVEAEAVAETEPAAEADTAVSASLPAPRRPRKPAFTPGRPVTAYSADELTAVVRWIDSDGVKRNDEELLRAAMKELGFARLGPRIKDALGTAVATARD